MFNFEERPISSSLAAIVGGVLIVFALAAFIWGLTTNFSYWWGQQGAIQEKNSTQNWTSAQRAFHQKQQDVLQDGVKIQQMRDLIATFDKAHPNLATEDGVVGMGDQQTRAGYATDLAGLQQGCLSTVGEYNTDARSYLTQDWRDADLPSSLSSAACN